MPRDAAEIIQAIGGEKASTSRRRSTLPHPRVKTRLIEENNDDIKALCRVVMRCPDADVLAQLHFVRQCMAESFLQLPDESLDWLIGGSSGMSRGGFQDGDRQTAVEKLREFLTADNRDISPQRLMTAIESIATAMGYRVIHASWVVPPFKPETAAQQVMDDVLQKLMKEKLTQYIGAIYTAREGDGNKNVALLSPSDTVQAEQEFVSSATGADTEDQLPESALPARTFRKEVRPGHHSWIGAAVDGGIDVRSHTSGTCPLTLSAIDGLCSIGEWPRATWMRDDGHVRALAGALVIATYQRGDFHTVAETACGVNHYLMERAIMQGEQVENMPLQPQEAFQQAMDMLVAASSKSYADEEDTMSIHSAVRKQAEVILSRTSAVKAVTSEFDPKDPEAFYQDKGAKVPRKYTLFKPLKPVDTPESVVLKEVPEEDNGYSGDDDLENTIEPQSPL
jgi:hypothetical protein